MDPFAEWESRRKAFVDSVWNEFEKAGLRKGHPDHAHFELGIEKKIKDWLHDNPVPGAVKDTKKGEEFLSTEEKLRHLAEEERMAKMAREAEAARVFAKMRRARNMGRGIEGVSNLGTVVGVAGTAGVGTAVMVGAKALFKLWVEDKLLSGAISGMEHTMTAVEQANCPATVKQAEGQYASYVKSCTHVYRGKGDEFTVQDEVMPKEKWLMMTYGVRWDVLTK